MFESEDALKLSSDIEGVFLENVEHGKTVYLSFEETRELIQCLSELLDLG